MTMNQEPTDNRRKPVPCEFSDMIFESAQRGGFDNGASREEFYGDRTVWERVTREFLRRIQIVLEEEVRSSPLPEDQPVGPALQSRESIAVAFECPKVAALSFPRVWGPGVPATLSGYLGTPQEQEILKFRQYVANPQNACLFEGRLRASMLSFATPKVMDSLVRSLPNTPANAQRLAEEMLSRGMYSPGAIARVLSSVHGAAYTAVYDCEASREAAYQPGCTSIVLAVLTQLEVVDEATTTWDQVVEFRSDSEARQKYNRLVHWLDGDMVGKPASYIVGEVGKRLDSYRWAIRKHGLKTAIGSIRMALDKDTLVGSAATGVAAAVMAGDARGVLAAGGVVTGKVLLHLVEELLDLENIKRTTNPEVAYVHDAKKALS